MRIGNATNLEKAVIDTSVVVKWFSEEAHTEKAELLLLRVQRGQIHMYAPELLVYELGNALWKGKKFEENRILAALDELFESRMEFMPIDKVLVQSAVRIMVRYDITFYDAVYGALAFSFDIPLVTADPKDHKKIKEITVIDLATLL